MKLYLGKPLHLVTGAGRPGAKAKSNDELMCASSLFLYWAWSSMAPVRARGNAMVHLSSAPVLEPPHCGVGNVPGARNGCALLSAPLVALDYEREQEQTTSRS